MTWTHEASWETRGTWAEVAPRHGGTLRAGGGLGPFCTVDLERGKQKKKYKGRRKKDVGSLEPRLLPPQHVSERSSAAESPEGGGGSGREREEEEEPFIPSSFCRLLPPQFLPASSASDDGLVQPCVAALGTTIWDLVASSRLAERPLAAGTC